MNKILACTDGSLYAPSVFRHAAWAADRLEVPVHVLHMLDLPRLKNSRSSRPADAEAEKEVAAFEEIRNRLTIERGQIQLAAAQRQLDAAGVQEIEVELQYGGLAEAVVRRPCDLVVLGKRGESVGCTRHHLGVNLESVTRSSLRPVLVASRKFAPIDSFLLAWDGGQSVHKALQFALEEPLLRGLRCHVVQAGQASSPAMLDAAVDRLRASGFAVTVEVTPGEPGQVIGEAVRREGIGLLVMGAYGNSRLRSLVVGSTTAAMILARQVPVLMFRQQTEIRAYARYEFPAGQAAEPQFV